MAPNSDFLGYRAFFVGAILALSLVATADAQRSNLTPADDECNPTLIARAYREKARSWREEGVPERLVNNLIARIAPCVHCIRDAPDKPTIVFDWTPGREPKDARGLYLTGIAWDPTNERIARGEVKAGILKSFRIVAFTSTCECNCGGGSTIQDGGPGVTVGPNDLGTPPEDLGPEVEEHEPEPVITKPTKKTATARCPACAGDAAALNGLANALDAEWDRKITLEKEIWRLKNALIDNVNEVNRLVALRQLRTSGVDFSKIDEIETADDRLHEQLREKYEGLDGADANIKRITGQIAAQTRQLEACEATRCITNATAITGGPTTAPSTSAAVTPPIVLKDDPATVGERDVARLRRAEAALTLGSNTPASTSKLSAPMALALSSALGRTVDPKDAAAVGQAQLDFDAKFGPSLRFDGSGAITFPWRGPGLATFLPGTTPTLTFGAAGGPLTTFGASNGHWIVPPVSDGSAGVPNVAGIQPLIFDPDGFVSVPTDNGTLTFGADVGAPVTFANFQGLNYLVQPSAAIGAPQVNQILDFGGELGGPVVKDRLWFWGSGNRNAIDPRTIIGPFDGRTLLTNGAGKLTGQLTSTNEANIFFHFDNNVKQAQATVSIAPVTTTVNQPGASPMFKVEDQQIFGSNTLLAGTFAHLGANVQYLPGRSVLSRADYHDQFKGVEYVFEKRYSSGWTFGANLAVNNWTDHFQADGQGRLNIIGTDRPRDPITIDGSYFQTSGRLDHDFKFGLSYRNTPVQDSEFLDAGGLFAVPSARDPWSVLALVPGIQSDRVNVAIDVGQLKKLQAAPTLPGASVWNIDGVNITDASALGSSPTYYDFGAIEEMQVTTGGNDVSQLTGGLGINIVTKRGSNDLHGSAKAFLPPRIGTTYQFGDKTLLKANYALYADQIGLSSGTNISPLTYAYAYTYFHDTSGDRTAPPNQILGGGFGCGGLCGSFGGPGDFRGQFDNGFGTPLMGFGPLTTPLNFTGINPGGPGVRLIGFQLMFLDGLYPMVQPVPAPPAQQDHARWWDQPIQWLASWFRLPTRVDTPPAFASSAVVRAAWRRDGLVQSPAQAPAAAAPAAPLEAAVTLKSTGASTGQAFTLEVVNPTNTPFKVAVREGTVLEAVQLPPAPGNVPPPANVIRQSLNGYCLDFAKQPPAAGVTYRMADQATQEKFRPMRDVLRAARRLQQAGKLGPGGPDSAGYLDATKQWALWSKLESWSEKQFADAFLDRTKKNLQQMKVAVTKEIENQVKAMIPGRWQHVQAVLAEAVRLAKDKKTGNDD